MIKIICVFIFVLIWIVLGVLAIISKTPENAQSHL